MTQVAAIAASLLRGDVLSIMTGFQKFACTNLPRELSRSIEQKFKVKVSKTEKEFISTYGHKGTYFQYRLNHTEYNKDGIERMAAYVKEQMGDTTIKNNSNKGMQSEKLF